MFYQFWKKFFYLIFRYFCHWRVEGAENLPKNGAVVVVANHTSNWDPVVIGVALNRPIHFVAKEELFKYPVFGRVCRGLKAFPVRRGSLDRSALKQILAILQQGEVLGVFPEGHRSRTGEVLPFQSTITHIALRGRAAVVPIGLKGTKGIWSNRRFHSFSVRIGKPINLSAFYDRRLETEEVSQLTETIRSVVAELAY